MVPGWRKNGHWKFGIKHIYWKWSDFHRKRITTPMFLALALGQGSSFRGFIWLRNLYSIELDPSNIDLAKPKRGASDFITISFFLSWVDFPELLRFCMIHKTRVVIRFRAKKPLPQTSRNSALVCLCWGRSSGWSSGRSRDYPIFSDG